jgi:hypothetical protein
MPDAPRKLRKLVMPQLELTVTERIDPQRAQQLATELREHLEVADPTFVRRYSGDPAAIPQYIQLIGDVVPWLALLYPAKWFLKSYLETLGPIAAHATRERLAALFKKEVKPLAEVATALADAREASGGRIDILVGLDVPDPHFGTALRITADSAEEIAHALAVFVTRASDLSTKMKAEVEAGRAPLGRAIISLDEDGGLTVRWRSQKDFAEHEKRIP